MRTINTSIRFLLLSLFALLTTGSLAANPGPRVDAYLRALSRQGGFSGTALVARDGKVLLNRGYGPANREWNLSNRPRTKFRVGSITKPFTAAAILLLQECGKLRVQDPIGKYLADCPEAWKGVTIHHLLSHTSGISDQTIITDPAQRAMPPTLDVMAAYGKDKPLQFQPGEKWAYSNAGYILLGYLIEKVSGQRYAQFLQENFFTPLGMADTGYDDGRQVVSGRAAPYVCKGITVINAAWANTDVAHAAGALYSTTGDLYRWERALFGGRVLSPASLQAMTTVVAGDYGYGQSIGNQFKRTVISHIGRINGYVSYLGYFPDERVTIVLLLNYDIGLVAIENLSRDVAAICLGEKYQQPAAKAAPVDPSLLDAYAGTYELAPDYRITVTRKGDHLFAQAGGQAAVELFPTAAGAFFIKGIDTRIAFTKDDKGQITGMTLLQNGNHAAKKL
ncbi:MAG: serine hydrolase [Armatimonadota bacterium]